MAVSFNPGRIPSVDAQARRAHDERPVSRWPGTFTRSTDKVHRYRELGSPELTETAASIRNFVESKGGRVDFDFNGRSGNAMPAFAGVALDLPMNEYGKEKRLSIQINAFDGVSSNPRLTQGQLTASLMLVRSALMEGNQLQVG